MFNFTTTFKTKKHTFEVKDTSDGCELFQDGEESGWSDINAREANLFIEQLHTIIDKQVAKCSHLNNVDFKTLLSELSYLIDGTGILKTLKQVNCGHGRRSTNGPLDILIEEVYILRHRCYNTINFKKYSFAQQLVLDSVIDHMPNAVDTYDMSEWYNVAKDDASKIKTFMKEVNSFNYEEYGLTYKPTKGIKIIHKEVLAGIKDFKTLIKESGNDIINWSQHKITRRKNTLKLDAYLGSYIEEYCDHLKKLGVKPEIETKKVKEDLSIRLEGGSELSQEELFKLFKQGNDFNARSVVPNFSLETVYTIMDSELKCVKNKLFTRLGGKTSVFNVLALRACVLSETKKDYRKIFEWAGVECLTFDFMEKHQDHLTTANLVEFCETKGVAHQIEENFFQKCFTKINKELNVTYGITWNFMLRMTDQEKIKLLKRVEGISIDLSTLYSLYHKVDYSKIEDTIKSSDTLKQHLCLKLAKDNDDVAMVDCLKEVGDKLSTGEKRTLFTKISFEQKKDVILKNVAITSDYTRSYFTGAIKLLSDEQNFNLLESLLETDNNEEYVAAIVKKMTGTKPILPENLARINKIVVAKSDLGYFPINAKTISVLLTKTKVKLLQDGLDLPEVRQYYSYDQYNTGIDNTLGMLFFKNFKRSHVNQVVRHVVHSPYTMFIGHVMEDDELIAASESDNAFFREYLDKLSYNYLKQFKDKKKFKAVVGDCRDRANKRFAFLLAEKINVSNAMDFIFTD